MDVRDQDLRRQDSGDRGQDTGDRKKSKERGSDAV